MKIPEYDLTYDDLNPHFYFTGTMRRVESETNYHAHEFIELSIITKGRGTYYIDGKEYPVTTGDLIIFNPGTYHKSLLTCPEDTAVEYYIGFSNIHLRDQKPDTFPLPGGRIVSSMREIVRQDVFKICDAMRKEYQTYHRGRYFILKAYLIQLLVILLREQQETIEEYKGYVFNSINKKYIVTQMKRFFTEHYHEKISLDQVAQNMYLSTFYISKIFKSETGDTPINYLIELRMEKARDLIENEPSFSVQKIAAMVGYDDAYHFSKLFKKHFGVAPTKYRNPL